MCVEKQAPDGVMNVVASRNPCVSVCALGRERGERVAHEEDQRGGRGTQRARHASGSCPGLWARSCCILFAGLDLAEPIAVRRSRLNLTLMSVSQHASRSCSQGNDAKTCPRPANREDGHTKSPLDPTNRKEEAGAGALLGALLTREIL